MFCHLILQMLGFGYFSLLEREGESHHFRFLYFEVLRWPFLLACQHQTSNIIYHVCILAKNATVLVHDATFEKGQEHLARKVRHATVEEAIDVSKQANAEHLILTHFSQRHLLPAFDYSRNPNVGVAFDHTEVSGVCFV